VPCTALHLEVARDQLEGRHTAAPQAFNEGAAIREGGT
jgi:hypothetical protein